MIKMMMRKKNQQKMRMKVLYTYILLKTNKKIIRIQ